MVVFLFNSILQVVGISAKFSSCGGTFFSFVTHALFSFAALAKTGGDDNACFNISKAFSCSLPHGNGL